MLILSEGSGGLNGVYHPTILLYVSFFFRANYLSYRWFLRFLCTNYNYEDDFDERIKIIDLEVSRWLGSKRSQEEVRTLGLGRL